VKRAFALVLLFLPIPACAQQSPWGRPDNCYLQPQARVRGGPDFEHPFRNRPPSNKLLVRDPSRRPDGPP
jgi:hypothetical protein